MTRKRTAALIAVVAAAALGTGAYAGIPAASDEQLTITAQFEDSVGLYQGNAVSVLGMQIGSVTRIAPRGGYVEVTLAIDKGVDLPADVQAVTVNTSILTDRHIELTPAYRNGPKLRNGDVVGLARTRTPVEFDRTLASIDKLSVALRGDGQGQGPLADFLALGAQATSGNGSQIKASLDELAQALRVGADNGTQATKNIDSVVVNLSELAQVAANNDNSIREFAATLRRVSDVLAQEHLGTGSTGAKLNEILATSTTLLHNNRDRLKGTVSDAQAVTAAMVDLRREIAEAFDLMPLVADNTYNTIDTNAGASRQKGLFDKVLFDSQLGKEICNITNKKQLGCATGTIRDFGPDFGLSAMFDLMGGGPR